MNSHRHFLLSRLLRLRLVAVALTGFVVFGCSGSQGPAATPGATTEASDADSAGVEIELKQAAVASIDPSLNVASLRLQNDQGTATALFGVDYKGIPIVGLSLRTRQGKALATSQVEFSEEAKGVSEIPSVDSDAAAARVLELHGEDADVVDVQLVFLPTTKDEFTATSAVRQIESLRLVWFVRVQNPTESGSFPEIFDIYLDAQDGSLVGSRQEASYIKGLGHSYHSGDVTIQVARSSDPDGYVLIDAGQGGRQTYSAASTTDLNSIVPVISESLEFGGAGIRPDDFDDAFANGKLTEEGITSAVDLHYGIGQTWDFFAQTYGRNGPYNDGTAVDGVANVPCPTGQDILGAYSHSARKIYSCLPLANPSNWGALEGTHPEVVSHEFAHAVFDSELELTTPPPSDHVIEYDSLSEALAQIFSLVEKGKRFNMMMGQLWGDAAIIPWIGVDGSGWAPSSMDSQSMDYYCQSSTLFCPKTVETVVSEGFTNRTWPYRVGGIIRQLFWYLSEGVSPLSNPTLYGARSGTSHFLPATRGFSGLGVKRASELFYNAAVYSSVAYPNFHEFGNMLIQRAGDEDGQCSEKQKKVVDALAAVKIFNEPSDRDAPTVDLSVIQHGGVVEVTVDAVDPLGDSPQTPHAISRTSVKVDGTEVAQPALNAAGHGVATLPVGLFHNGPAASYTFLVEVEDGCKNIATKSVTRTVYLNRNLVVQQSGLPKQPRLTATLSDGGSLALVQFSADNGPLSTVTGPAPFQKVFDTSTWSDGPHFIFVSGQDTQGNIFETTHTITADNTPPTVTSFTSSTGNPPFTLTATATDVSPLTQAAFSLQGDLLPFATDTTAPYNASYTPTDGSLRTLKVSVKDSYGNEGVATRAAPLDATTPTVMLNANQSGGTVMVSANATDTCGFASMNTSVTGTAIGIATFNVPIANPSATNADWSYTFNTGFLSPGDHLLSADVTDRCGNTTHSESHFLVVASAPGVVVDAPVVPSLHPKLPTITVRVVHDRPIQTIQLQRQIVAGGIPLFQTFDTWAPPGGAGNNPIHTFQLNTSGTDWTISGNIEIRAIAFDDLGLPGSNLTHVPVDNEAPALSEDCTFLPAAVTCVVTGADFTVNGDNMSRLQAAQFPLPYVTRIASPWVITVVGAGVNSAYIDFIATAKDKFGNERIRAWSFPQSCQYSSQSNLWSCQYGPKEFPFGPDEILIKREP